jgi:hypothetical protein
MKYKIGDTVRFKPLQFFEGLKRDDLGYLLPPENIEKGKILAEVFLKQLPGEEIKIMSVSEDYYTVGWPRLNRNLWDGYGHMIQDWMLES